MAETIEKQYGNTKLVVPAEVDIEVYKCPHLRCKDTEVFFFSQDDLNQHRIVAHGEIPKTYMLVRAPKGTYFNRNSMARLSAEFQEAHLMHVLMVLGIDLEKLRQPIWLRIKRWLRGRGR